METLDAAKEDNELIASVSLLGMGIKTVPEAVLRKKFGDTANVLLDLMNRFADTDNQNVLRSVSYKPLIDRKCFEFFFFFRSSVAWQHCFEHRNIPFGHCHRR